MSVWATPLTKKIYLILSILSLTTTFKRKTRSVGFDNPVPNLWSSFVPSFCTFVDCLWLLLENTSSKKPVTNQLFGRKFCVVQLNSFPYRQDCEQVIFYKQSHLSIHGWSIRDNKVTFFCNWLKNRTFQRNWGKNNVFSGSILSQFTMLCKKKLKISKMFKVFPLNF